MTVYIYEIVKTTTQVMTSSVFLFVVLILTLGSSIRSQTCAPNPPAFKMLNRTLPTSASNITFDDLGLPNDGWGFKDDDIYFNYNGVGLGGGPGGQCTIVKTSPSAGLLTWNGTANWAGSSSEKPGFYMRTNVIRCILLFQQPISAFVARVASPTGTSPTSAYYYGGECSVVPESTGTNGYKTVGFSTTLPLNMITFRTFSDQPVFLDNIQYVVCPTGFAFNGTQCVNNNQCAGIPCGSHESCKQSGNDYYCACNDGYAPIAEEPGCHDIDECLTYPCTTTFTCVNTPGSYQCVCPTGYNLNNQTAMCPDIDECTTLSPCGDHFKCINNAGSYSCVCEDGYKLNNQTSTCDDIDECIDSPCVIEHSSCLNTNGSYECICNEGYEAIDGTCADIDECLNNPCGAHFNCLNTNGSYSCNCQDGYEYNNDTLTCDDIDECTTLSPCSSLANCTNTDGSFQCTCNEGYEGTGQGQDGCQAIQTPHDSNAPSSNGNPNAIQPSSSNPSTPAAAGRRPTSSLVSAATTSFTTLNIIASLLLTHYLLF